VTRNSWRPAALLTTFLLAVGGVAACGNSSDDKTSSTSSDTPSTTSGAAAGGDLAAQVPGAVKSKGTLKVAADASYAPNEFKDPGSGQIKGVDVDLAKAIGQKLGLKVDVQNATFDAIIPGLAAKKYDLGMSSFTDTKEREKTVDFVTYFTAGTSFYAKKSGAPKINGLADLCGKKVAVEKGTTQATDAAAQGKKCKAAGKPNVSVSVFPDQNGANLALASGRAAVGMADSPVAAYAVKKSGGQFVLIGKPYGEAPYGIAIPKGTGMDKPVLAAVKAIIADGTYKKVLTTWGVQDGAITNPVINGATS
jgi:polar amino acid transport system substrate-binding protein